MPFRKIPVQGIELEHDSETGQIRITFKPTPKKPHVNPVGIFFNQLDKLTKIWNLLNKSARGFVTDMNRQRKQMKKFPNFPTGRQIEALSEIFWENEDLID